MNLFKFFQKEKEPKVGEGKGENTLDRHKWKHIVTKLTKDHKKQDMLYGCEDCNEFKHEITDIKSE